jgi:type VI secretion system protein ImpM
MVSESELIPGWYGKIPSLGDFASRRLSQQFLSVWDNWLQHALTASRTLLGAGWLDIYMNSPVWRFALLPGVIGETLWGGVMMPSVDKVGRQFPLTIAVAIPAAPGCLAAVMGARDWYGDLEEAALATLNVDFSMQQFEEQLSTMPFPVTGAPRQDAATAALAGWWQSPSERIEVVPPAGCDMQRLLLGAATEVFQASGNGKSLWWRETDTSGPIQLACFSGLPHPDHYSTLLQGAAPPPIAAPAPASVPQLKLV